MNRKLAEIIETQKPLTLPPDATVRDACKEMYARRFGAVMVTSPDGRLAGIFTGRDAVRMLAEGMDPTTTALKDVMTTDLSVLAPEHTAIEAMRLMRDAGFRHVPVVHGGIAVGIVSREDFRGLERDRMDVEVELWERI